MNKLILLLAGSGMQEREIANALLEVESMDNKTLFKLIVDLRKYEHRPTQSDYLFTHTSYEGSKNRKEQMVGHQVSKMLRDDIGLTTSQASERLLAALRRNLSSEESESLPSLNKESFVSWVHKLSRHVPESLLMHEAAKIRNAAMHRSKSDWPLADKK